MITEHDGLGGISIIIENGNQRAQVDGVDYLVRDDNGITWVDFERAMARAEEINRQQQAGEIHDNAN